MRYAHLCTGEHSYDESAWCVCSYGGLGICGFALVGCRPRGADGSRKKLHKSLMSAVAVAVVRNAVRWGVSVLIGGDLSFGGLED